MALLKNRIIQWNYTQTLGFLKRRIEKREEGGGREGEEEREKGKGRGRGERQKDFVS